jgi:hypothetical protein
MSRCKKTYGQLYQEWQTKLAKYTDAYPDIQVVVQWGCHWLKERLSGQAAHFVTKIYKPIPPGEQFTVGNAIIPSRAEVFRMHWSSSESPQETMDAIDISSHYASVMINEEYPTGSNLPFLEQVVTYFYLGPGETYAEYDLNKGLHVDQEGAKYNGELVHGIIWLRILPPNVNVPFVPMLLKDGGFIYPVCAACAEKKQTKKCRK